MLRASAHEAGDDVDLRAITDRADDPGIPAGRELLAFATAVVGDHGEALDDARAALLDAAGPAAVVRASAVAGNFQMMNRLVDATGVPIGASLRAVAVDLGLDG